MLARAAPSLPAAPGTAPRRRPRAAPYRDSASRARRRGSGKRTVAACAKRCWSPRPTPRTWTSTRPAASSKRGSWSSRAGTHGLARRAPAPRQVFPPSLARAAPPRHAFPPRLASPRLARAPSPRQALPPRLANRSRARTRLSRTLPASEAHPSAKWTMSHQQAEPPRRQRANPPQATPPRCLPPGARERAAGG